MNTIGRGVRGPGQPLEQKVNYKNIPSIAGVDECCWPSRRCLHVHVRVTCVSHWPPINGALGGYIEPRIPTRVRGPTRPYDLELLKTCTSQGWLTVPGHTRDLHMLQALGARVLKLVSYLVLDSELCVGLGNL